MLENSYLRFEWDEKKNRANLKHHGIDFTAASNVFDDPFHVTLPDRFVQDEERFWTIGRAKNAVIVVVVHTARDENNELVVRLISARGATRTERKLYEEDQR
jgi:uncharacterized protein